MSKITRREFTRTTIALTAATALGSMRVMGANDRVNMGVIGCGGRGSQDMGNFLKQPDMTFSAVCDAYEPFRDRAVKTVAAANGTATAFKDFRQLLEKKDLDAILIATPDHWHALMTIYAVRAGKDVYCEKPLSLMLHEGRLMTDEARKHKRVVAVGSQQRSGAHYAEAVKLIQGGEIGEVHHISAGMTRNAMPGFVARELRNGLTDALDWDMWLGPAPKVPFNPFRAIYHFRWFWDYSGGQMTNWGAHHLDIARWALNAEGPTAVAGFGGRYAMKDGGETPDVQQVIYNFPTCVVNWSTREINQGDSQTLTFYGTKASLDLTRGGYKIRPERWTGQDPADPDKKWEPATQAREVKGGDLDAQHVRNFLDCVKSRQRPNADIEEGHRSAVMCHLGNLSTRLGRSLKWDSAKERVTNDDEANKLLMKEYRKPWSLSATS